MQREPVDQDTYRAFMSSFPTGVAVVTTIDPAGLPRGLTCSSLCSVSLAPPILSVCLARHSASLRALLDHGHFGVNLLGARGSSLARLFADSSVPHFDRVPWHPVAGLPRLDGGVIAFAACRVSEARQVGDHVVVFGEMFDSDGGAGAPLLYGRRQFADWPTTATMQPTVS